MKHEKTIMIIMIIMLSLISACNNEDLEKLNQEALSLTSEDVPNWLDKHSISIPNGLANQMDINNYVIEIIEYTKAWIDASVTSYDKTMFFIQDIQEAAGYFFANRREAMFLEKKDIQNWLNKHKISIPGDLEKELDVDEFVLTIINDAQQGIDSSIGLINNQTIEFIKEIQSTAGYSLNT